VSTAHHFFSVLRHIGRARSALFFLIMAGEMIPETTIQEAVKLLQEAGNPSRIILFGSYGRGNPHADSDLDLLVIQPVVQNRRRAMVHLRRVLSPLRIPADVLVVSEQAFQDWSDTPGNILYEAAREGRVLYETA
jgi:predicted nucleotidyltransferase